MVARTVSYWASRKGKRLVNPSLLNLHSYNHSEIRAVLILKTTDRWSMVSFADLLLLVLWLPALTEDRAPGLDWGS